MGSHKSNIDIQLGAKTRERRLIGLPSLSSVRQMENGGSGGGGGVVVLVVVKQ